MSEINEDLQSSKAYVSTVVPERARIDTFELLNPERGYACVEKFNERIIVKSVFAPYRNKEEAEAVEKVLLSPSVEHQLVAVAFLSECTKCVPQSTLLLFQDSAL